MKQIFSISSPLYRFISRFWDMVKLNFLWLVFSLPIITIGASTVAAYSVTLKMVDDQEGKIGEQFLKAFKENLKQGTIMGLIAIFVSYAVYLNFELFNKVESNPLPFLIAAIVLLFVELLHITYAFPLCARYKDSVKTLFRNSAAIAMKYFLRTLLLWVVVAVFLVLFLFNTTLMYVGLLIGPASIFLTVSGFSMRFFREIEKDMESAE